MFLSPRVIAPVIHIRATEISHFNCTDTVQTQVMETMRKEILAVLIVGLAVLASGCTAQDNGGEANDQPQSEGEEQSPLLEDENETENNTTNTTSPEGVSSSYGEMNKLLL